MFAPDRQGFFAGLWVQFLQELLDVDKEEFRKITTKEERFTWMYNNRFVKVELKTLKCAQENLHTFTIAFILWKYTDLLAHTLYIEYLCYR